MANLCTNAPAIAWRAFCFLVLTSATGLRAAPPSATPPPLSQVGLPDDAERARILEQFRSAMVPGQYYLEFSLHELPRRGDEKVFPGKLWGARNEQGAVNRVSVTTGDGKEVRLLIQNGAQPAVWRFADGKVTQLDIGAFFDPVVPGVELTTFDLLRPFVFWTNATLEKIDRVRGRPANAFVFHAPAEFTAKHPDITGVRAYLDTQFVVPLQTEVLGAGNRVLKTIALLDLKRIKDQTIPETFDVRNELTRDKTRLVVNAAALNLDLSPSLFAPATLADDIRPPDGDRLVRIEP